MQAPSKPRSIIAENFKSVESEGIIEDYTKVSLESVSNFVLENSKLKKKNNFCENELENLLKTDFEQVVPTFIIVAAKICAANDNDCEALPSEPCAADSQSETKVDMSTNSKGHGVDINFNNNDDSYLNPQILISADVLMPWSTTSSRENFKEKKTYEIMSSKLAIMDLYKCMDLNCAYTTKFKTFFQSHIEDHQRQASFTSFFNLCAYCDFTSMNPGVLALHITEIHSFSKFQCSKCFFRTAEKETGHEHMLIHHKQEHGAIYHCPGSETRTVEEINSRVVEMRARNVKPIPCKCG